MSLGGIRSLYFEALGNLYEESEVESIFNRITHHLLNYSKIQIRQHLHEGIHKPTAKLFNEYLKRLKHGEPVQYVIGFAEFYNQRILVNPAVLIPRPETEELVDLVVREQKHLHNLNIIDLCTGSGCIAIALAKALNTKSVQAIDISNEALDLAHENAKVNNANVLFLTDDIQNLQNDYGTYEIIVSNPPYVCESEKKQMHINILNFEPEPALFVSDNDPLVFYRAIARFGSDHLAKTGTLYVEINEQLGAETMDILSAAGYKEVFIKKDIRQKERFIVARL
jgi:release factor glutamine methyltransferase